MPGAKWQCGACNFSPPIVDGIPLLAPAMAQPTGEDAAYHHAVLAQAESEHFWFVSRADLIAWALARYFPRARTFLDVGCGTGGVEVALGERRADVCVTAVDSQLQGLQLAKLRRPDVDFIQLDIRRLPFNEAFDATGAFDVIEHLDEDEAVLAQMHRATVPGGGLLITVPQHPSLWSAVDEFSHHRRRYTRHELQRKIESAGFRLLRITSFMTLVLPMLMAARLRKQDVDRLDPDAELRINAPLNLLLKSFCRFESAMIRAGASLPAGGSLLAVAERK